MLLDANEETFELIEIDGKEALFTNGRLDRTTVPEGNQMVSVENR